MTTTDRQAAGYTVVEDGGGFGVVREGDPQPISHHETREQAEEAARLHSGEGSEVDARHDILPGAGSTDADSAKHTFGAAALFAVAVILLIVVISLIVALG